MTDPMFIALLAIPAIVTLLAVILWQLIRGIGWLFGQLL